MDEQKILVSTYLNKRAKSHSWNKRWFVLRKNQLSYYKDSNEYKASKVIPINEVLSFSEIPDHHKLHFIIVTSERIYHLRAFNLSDYKLWINELRTILYEREKDHGDKKTQEKEKEEKKNISENEKEDKKETIISPNMKRQDSIDSVQTDFHNFNLSGTDDNFTSGLSDSTSTPAYNHGHLTNSLVNLPPLPEEDGQFPTILENGNTEVQSNTNNNDHDLQYYNSFSYDNEEHVVGKGSLLRLKKRYNQWKKYFIILTNKFMYFYKTKKDFEAHKVYKKIDIKDVIDVVELDPLSKSKMYCMLIVTPKKRIRFSATTEDELTTWLVLLKTAIEANRKVDYSAA